jgi:2'-hydroxyisoflavone reductase
MRILILGGTKFLGRHFVEAALARGHELTLFTRGKHDAQAFAGVAGVTSLRGDRRTGPFGLAALAEPAAGPWDAVVDTSGFLPQDVEASAQLLRDRVSGVYLFVSSISAYAGFEAVGMTEDAPLAPYTDAARDVAESLAPGAMLSGQALGEHYGALKAECERVAQKAFGARALVVRPGLIVGPYDPTDRFTYWPSRVARGGDVLAPGRPERPIQLIDARDLAEWMVSLCERGQGGTYHATGPAEGTLTMGAMLDACIRVGADRGAPPARLVWASEEFLLEHKVAPWSEMPVWIPEGDASMAGFARADVTRARAAGLKTRSIAETAADTLAWDATRDPDAPRAAGLSADRERDVLATLMPA